MIAINRDTQYPVGCCLEIVAVIATPQRCSLSFPYVGGNFTIVWSFSQVLMHMYSLICIDLTFDEARFDACLICYFKRSSEESTKS